MLHSALHLWLIACFTVQSEALGEVQSDSNETLTEGLIVFKELSDVKQHLFAKTFYKFDPQSLISALESASILVGMPKADYNDSDENAGKTIIKYIREISLKMKDLFAVTGYSNYNLSMVHVNIGATSSQIIYVENIADITHIRKAEFLREYGQDEVEKQVPIILNEFAWFIPKNVSLETHFDPRKFQAAQSLIVQYFFQAYILKYIRAGIEHSGQEYTSDLERLSNSFMTDYLELKKTLTLTTELYRASFFPGFVQEDIVKTGIDCILNPQILTNCDYEHISSLDNCNIANHIVRNVKDKFPWRNYAVIVSDAAVNNEDYVYFGFPNRTVVEKYYNGKTVLVFMATKEYLRNFNKYIEGNESEKIFRMQIAGKMESLLEYAKNGNDYVQMAVFKEMLNPCFIEGNEKIGHQTVWQRSEIPNNQNLGVYVVF